MICGGCNLYTSLASIFIQSSIIHYSKPFVLSFEPPVRFVCHHFSLSCLLARNSLLTFLMTQAHYVLNCTVLLYLCPCVFSCLFYCTSIIVLLLFHIRCYRLPCICRFAVPWLHFDAKYPQQS